MSFNMKMSVKAALMTALSVFTVISGIQNISAQSPDTVSLKRAGVFLEAGSGFFLSNIIETENSMVPDLTYASGSSFQFYLGVGYFFSRHFGIIASVEYLSFKNEFSLENYQDELDAVDTEDEAYTLKVTGTKIKENQDFTFVSLPMALNMSLPIGKSLSFYIQAETRFTIPLKGDYTNNGVYTYKGYYPSYNVLFEDLPAYGFPENLVTDVRGELELKPLIISIGGSAGFDVSINNKFQLGVGAFICRSLSDITDYSGSSEFHLSEEVNSVNSLLDASNDTRFNNMGIKLHLRYYLTR